MPLNINIGEQTGSSKHKENRNQTEDQARHVYKKVELGDIININTDRKLNRLDDTSGDINPYTELILIKQKRLIQFYHK